MRWALAFSAVVLSGCSGGYSSLDTSETDARQIPILAAAMDCNVEEIRRRAPTEHSTRDRNGVTALQWAFTRECESGVLALLEAGADPNAAANRRWTPLCAAASTRNSNLVKALVERGANVNGASFGSMFPIHHAAGSGSVEVVRYLLSKGADAKATDAGGMTALHMGARFGDVVRVLLAAGIDKDAASENLATPLFFAHDWPYFSDRSGAAGARVLLAAGANVNAADSTGHTPLMNAVSACDSDAATELIGAGAHVNAADRNGRTAMQLLRAHIQQERGIGSFLWSFFDPSIRRIADCRGELEQTLAAAGAK